MSSYIYREESNILMGLAFQLHKELGCGFKEKVYQDAFEVLLKEKQYPLHTGETYLNDLPWSCFRT